jgi:large subunit ribosomal protein L4
MKIDVVNTSGEVVANQELDETVWGIEPNISVMHQALLRQQANARLGTHDTKTRGEVRGGGRKPWRQKGTGRARQGSTRAPQWVGGGVVWGPHPRKYTQSMPKQMSRLAIRSALSAKVQDKRLTVIQGLSELEPRTKAMKTLLENLPPGRSILIVIPEKNDAIERASGNLENVRTCLASYVNVRDLLKYERVVITPEAIEKIESLWALPENKRTPSAFKLARQAASGESAASVKEA